MRAWEPKRAIAFLAGVGVLALALLASAFAALVVAIGAQAPDAFMPDGDPCCSSPDTWSEVIAGAAVSTPVAAAVGALYAVSAGLVSWALRRTWPRPRVLAWFPALAVGLLLIVLVAAWIADEPRLRAECESFAFQQAAWREGSEAERMRTADALARCGVVEGRSREDVRRLLGEPTLEGEARGSDRDGTYMSYEFPRRNSDSEEDAAHDLTIFLIGRRVDHAEFSAYCC